MKQPSDVVLDIDSEAPLTIKTMMKLWGEVFFPMLEQTFVTKDELRHEFEIFEHTFDQKLEKRIRPLEKEIDLLRDDVNEMKEKAFTFQREVYIKLDTHVHAIQKLNARVFPASMISESSEEEYKV